jgi:hypothetical protein
MSDASFDEAAWAADLRAHREEKDEFFAEHAQSPIPTDDRGSFEGLSYFPPNPRYRVEATVEVNEDPGTVVMERTVGDEVEYHDIATLHFEVDDEMRTLEAYRQPGSTTLFVPFRDATSGGETYGAGRYMEFDVERELEDGETLVLDFNLAYSPFCAYDDQYACPLPPAENHLDVAIEAGERHPPQG